MLKAIHQHLHVWGATLPAGRAAQGGVGRWLVKAKGKRQILTVHVDTAAEAGIEMFTFEMDERLPAVRAAAPDVFIQTGFAQGHMPSEDIAIREGFRAMKAGVDVIYFTASLRIVEAMAREGIPVTGHIGYVPRWRTWTGVRAVGQVRHRGG